MQADLVQYRDHSRLLVLFAPHRHDPRLVRQEAAFQGESAGMRERQLVLIVVLQDSAVPARLDAMKLRRKYHVDPDAFEAFLIGKDGTVAYRTKKFVTPKALYARIDRMPMRRDEMRRNETGKGDYPH